MDGEQNVEVEQTDAIRKDIEQTRESLAQKIETLETEVRHTVNETKASVSESVEEVKKVFDPKYLISRYPWAALGLSIGAGVLVGRLAAPVRFPSQRRSVGFGASSGLARESYGSASQFVEPTAEGTVHTASEPQRGRSTRTQKKSWSFVKLINEQMEDELRELKQLALGTLMSVVRDIAVQSAPPTIAPKLNAVADRIIQKAGAKPADGPVLTPQTNQVH